MIKVNVFSEEKAWSKKLKNTDLFFKKICKAFPKKYQFVDKKISFSLLLSNNKKIKKLNKFFRKKNKSTDILSFPIDKKINILNNTYLGDIIISYD
ncbi:rRNA maturation RNase YbeY, partial [Candidatus Pelagibacter sp.]|nr:rRNA maturation RNase YbeY [Candidatus Pelagibacter sp.]